jgi:hypothetical protein
MPKHTTATRTPAPARRRPAATTTTPPPSGTAAQDGADPGPHTDPEEAVRLMAYHLYEARGGADGHALEDWLQAEANVAAERGRASTA